MVLMLLYKVDIRFVSEFRTWEHSLTEILSNHFDLNETKTMKREEFGRKLKKERTQ